LSKNLKEPKIWTFEVFKVFFIKPKLQPLSTALQCTVQKLVEVVNTACDERVDGGRGYAVLHQSAIFEQNVIIVMHLILLYCNV